MLPEALFRYILPFFSFNNAPAGRRHPNPLLRIYNLNNLYMQVFVNSKAVQTDAGNLSELINQLGLPAVGVAAAVSNKMVPRAEWAECALTEGAQVTVIKAACGG